jgi:hypothetical protein
MVQALWANSNYDDEKGTRQQAITDIEESFMAAIEAVTGGQEQEEEEIDKSDPFFAPAFKQMEKLEVPVNADGTVEEVIDYSQFIDQG